MSKAQAQPSPPQEVAARRLDRRRQEDPVYEAGIANLTKEETTMMVHYGKDRSQQFTLVRVEEKEGEGKSQ